MGLPTISVKRPVTILMVYVAIIIIGIISLSRLPVELMPNYSFGDISIFVDIRGGMTPTEVETLVTKPIEEAVGTVSHLKDIVSISEEGRSRVVLSFEPGINMDFAALEVREKFSRVRNKLPPEIEKPVIAKFEQSDVPVMILAIMGKNYTPEMLRRLVDDFIKEELMRVEGVANIDIGGGRERKILIEVSQDKLRAFNIPLGRLISMVSVNNLNLLLGDIEKKKNKYLLRAIGEAQNIEDIKRLGIASTPAGTIVRLSDVAEVKDSFLEATSFARVNALPVVTLYIQKESIANTVKVSEGIQKELDKIKLKLPKEIKVITTYDQAESIKRAIKTVQNALYQGAVLATLVLFIFLHSLRSVFIIGVAIPISIIATFILMFFNKISLNVMTLSGLALGSGMLVDNSIVVLDNIFKLLEKKFDRVKAAIIGAEEMMLAIVSSTITTVIVFLPIVFVNEEIRLLYSGLAMTVTFSLIISLVVAITLVPMLNAHLGFGNIKFNKMITPTVAQPKTAPRNLLRKLRYNYSKLLIKCIRKRGIVLVTIFIAFVISTIIFDKGLEKEFIGTTEADNFTIFIELPTGAKLDISDKAVKDIEAVLAKIKEVKTFTARVEPWSSKVYVRLVPLEQRSVSIREVVDSLRPKVADIEKKYKEAFIYFEEQQAVESNEIIIEIFGYDYDILNELAVGVLGRLQAIEGLTDLKIRWRRGRPEWQVKVNKEKAASFGLTVEDVADAVHAEMRGLRATVYRTEGKEVEVIARLQESDRDTLEKVRRLAVPTPSGRQIYLQQVADFVPGVGPSKIWRRNKSRMIQVSANRGRYAFGTAAELIRKSISDMKFPKDYYSRLGENYWKMIQNQKELTFALILTLILIYLVLASLFESYVQPLIIMVAVPLASIGVVTGLKLTHKSVNMGVLIGIIMLGGIVVNHSIILVDRINYFREKGMNKLRAIVVSGSDRLRPILMTTITAVLGLVPMALDKSEEASLWSPLAVTVIGGLVTSTILTLAVVPCMYVLFEDFKVWLVNFIKFVDFNRIINRIKIATTSK